MTFNLKATVIKQLWASGTSYLYQVEDQEKQKKWTVFTNEQLSGGQVYEFSGKVSEAKDKKTKDANGRDIWRTNFNAEKITGVETMDNFTQDDGFTF